MFRAPASAPAGILRLCDLLLQELEQYTAVILTPLNIFLHCLHIVILSPYNIS